ncbi:MAG: MATE family efflux transporter [Acidimicrobiales bacterium]|nr:MATE family efflux transporter [Acidimicrobiales bacterium]
MLRLLLPGRPRWTETDRRILALAFPALGALVAEPLYILADTAVVGHLGTPQLAGLALASSLLLIAFAVFIFLAYGTTSAVSRLLGAGEHRQAAHQAVQSLWLAFGVGLVIASITYLFRNPLISVMGGDGETAVNAEIYLRISLLGIPPMLMVLAGVGYLRGLQDTKRPLYVAVGTAILNLVLELVLIYGLDYGIGASALSTVIAQWVGAGAYCWWIARAVTEHDVGLTPDWKVIGKLAGAGLDLLMRTAALRGGITVTVAVAARIGTDDLAAHEIAFQIWSILALSLDAVAIAAQAMIGHALGAGDAQEARRLGDRMIQWGWWGGFAMAALVFALIPVLPDVFSADPEVVSLAAFLFIHVAVWQPVNGIVFALDGILIGAGDLRFLAIAMVTATAVLVPWSFSVLWFDLGIGWLWGAIGAWMVVRAATLLWRYQSDAWAITGATRG